MQSSSIQLSILNCVFRTAIANCVFRTAIILVSCVDSFRCTAVCVLLPMYDCPCTAVRVQLSMWSFVQLSMSMYNSIDSCHVKLSVYSWQYTAVRVQLSVYNCPCTAARVQMWLIIQLFPHEFAPYFRFHDRGEITTTEIVFCHDELMAAKRALTRDCSSKVTFPDNRFHHVIPVSVFLIFGHVT